MTRPGVADIHVRQSQPLSCVARVHVWFAAAAAR